MRRLSASRRSEPLGTLGDGKGRPPLAGTFQSTRTPTTGGRPPDSGVDMATQSSEMGRIVSAVKARFTVVSESISARSARHRRRAVLTQQHRLNFDLLCKAMDDPALAAVLDTYETDVPPEKQRQFLFANALYINALYFHRIGALSRDELYGHLRVMCQNRVFREYWEATRHHRKSLPETSEEFALGRMTDDLIQDQDDSDSEEWWVVGEPPGESP
ncbi:DUF6082 family protein [Streptomyces sp. NPDC001982]|uniref:DUF6082 family protein n=1 Tax=unclassified Streptomyces TaxID=2593676 RepID=UPI0033300BB0